MYLFINQVSPDTCVCVTHTGNRRTIQILVKPQLNTIKLFKNHWWSYWITINTHLRFCLYIEKKCAALYTWWTIKLWNAVLLLCHLVFMSCVCLFFNTWACWFSWLYYICLSPSSLLCVCIVWACWLEGGWAQGGGLYMMLYSVWPGPCVLHVLLHEEERDRATRHGSGQECATWVACTIELGSLMVVNGTSVTRCTLPAGWWPPHIATAVRSFYPAL